MTKTQIPQIFESKDIRSAWDDKEEKWYFSVVDIVAALTDSDYQTARKYWKVLKGRILKEGNELVTNCYQLKMPAPDGKMRLTDVTDIEQMLRIVQSIPSPKAEPFKQWLAEVGRKRLEQAQDPELSIQQAVHDYKRLGYSEKWINERLRSIEVRNELTDEWQRSGVSESKDFAFLTAILTREWSGKTPAEYRKYKGLKGHSLRDNMSNVELALNTLAEASTTELSKQRNPRGVNQSAEVARQGGKVAKVARQQLESQLGRSVITSENAMDLKRLQGGAELQEDSSLK